MAPRAVQFGAKQKRQTEYSGTTPAIQTGVMASKMGVECHLLSGLNSSYVSIALYGLHIIHFIKLSKIALPNY